MADVAHLEGSSAPGAAPEFMPIATEPPPPPKTDTAFAGPDVELLALIAEAKVATTDSRTLGERRDALCEPMLDRPAYEAAHDQWAKAQDRLWTFWPRIAALRAMTAQGWMAKATLCIETPEQLADARADEDPSEAGNSIVAGSLILDLAEASFTKQAEGVAHIPPAALDAPILDAWAKRQEVFKRYEVASDLAEGHLNTYASSGSELAELFRPRETDFSGYKALIGKLPVDPNGFYTLRAVNVLRGIDASSPHCVRAAEIVESYDRYNTPSAEHLAADAALEAITAELHSFDDAIRDTPALSLEGIGIKASWALLHTAKGEQDMRAVLGQVQAFTRRHSAPARMPNVPFLEREAMGGLPAADWKLYHLWLDWLREQTESEACQAEYNQACELFGEESEQCEHSHRSYSESLTRTWAFRQSMLQMPAASLQGVQLKALVYHSLCRGQEVMRENEEQAQRETAAGDAAFAFNIASDLVRLGCPQVLFSSAEAFGDANRFDIAAVEPAPLSEVA